ncbi:MAG: thymidylate synthase [bacterium]|nr:thymidylate synthase [bacterium]
MNPNYKSFEERVPDLQYLNLVQRIRDEGRYTKTRFQTNGTFSHFGLAPLDYKFENGFPMIPERSLKGSWAKYVNELAAFINGAVTVVEMSGYGTDTTWANWWSTWVYEEKCKIFGLPANHLGGASYGAILAQFPTPNGTFNQFEHLLKQMREMPDLRTHMVTTWYPPGALQHSDLVRDVVVAPCHGTDVKYTIIDGFLTCNHVQRSVDLTVGGTGNIVQWAALELWMAHVLDLVPLDYIHYFMDAQIYEDQMEKVDNELLAKEYLTETDWRYVRGDRAFPTLRVKEDAPKDFFAFRAEHFELTDYNPHLGIKFPVTE